MRARLVLALCVLPCAAAVAAGADLERAFLAARELGHGWDVVREAPGDPSRDPDLVGWGVREQQVRHYTRDRLGVLQVCSVEIWRFASLEQARAAHAGFHYPGWKISRTGTLLVMLHGLSRPWGQVETRGVFAECGAIGSRILERASRL